MRRLLLIPTVLLAAIGGGCASSGAVPHPFPMPVSARDAAPATLPATVPATEPATVPATEAGSGSATVSATASARVDEALFQAIVETAMNLRGAPYKNGGGTPKGFDCSGFTQFVFAQHGLALPREVRDQFSVGAPIDPSADLLAGDLLFFTTTAPGASHVAISLGGDEFVHAPSSKGVVRVEKLTTGYWNERFLGARRLTQP
ncbi:MAG TPA: NlpC/P60 family protein [Vicinamibacterales bacterium]|nr:NlpC/P60 family protein [Vicinamibacterales bacterium]